MKGKLSLIEFTKHVCKTASNNTLANQKERVFCSLSHRIYNYKGFNTLSYKSWSDWKDKYNKNGQKRLFGWKFLGETAPSPAALAMQSMLHIFFPSRSRNSNVFTDLFIEPKYYTLLLVSSSLRASQITIGTITYQLTEKFYRISNMEELKYMKEKYTHI